MLRQLVPVQGPVEIPEMTVAFPSAPVAALGYSAVELGYFVAALGYSAAVLGDSVVALVGSVVVLGDSVVVLADSVVVLGDSVAAALGNFAAGLADSAVVARADTDVALVDFAVAAVPADTVAAVDWHGPSSTVVGLGQRHQVAERGYTRAAEKKLSGHAADSLPMTEYPEGEAALHSDQQLPSERRLDLLDSLRYFVACLRGQLPWHLHASENSTSCPEMTVLPYSACAVQERIVAPEPSPFADLEQGFPS